MKFLARGGNQPGCLAFIRAHQLVLQIESWDDRVAFALRGDEDVCGIVLIRYRSTITASSIAAGAMPPPLRLLCHLGSQDQ